MIEKIKIKEPDHDIIRGFLGAVINSATKLGITCICTCKLDEELIATDATFDLDAVTALELSRQAATIYAINVDDRQTDPLLS